MACSATHKTSQTLEKTNAIVQGFWLSVFPSIIQSNKGVFIMEKILDYNEYGLPTHESENVVSKWVDNFIVNELDSSIVTDANDWYERWEITGYDDEYLDENPEYGNCSLPTWSTWFEVSSYGSEWAEKHQHEIADLGFKIIWRTDDSGAYVFGIGLDYTGNRFMTNEWPSLYELYHSTEAEREELLALAS